MFGGILPGILGGEERAAQPYPISRGTSRSRACTTRGTTGSKACHDGPMAELASARSPSGDLASSPWLIRVCDRVPLPLTAIGVSIFLAHFLFVTMIALLLSWTLGGEFLWWGEGFSPKLVSDIVKSIIVGYVMAGGYYGLREAVRDFESLRPALGCDDIEFDHWMARLRHVDRVPLYLATALAVVWGFFGPLADQSWTGKPPPLGSAIMSWEQIKTFVLVFFISRIVVLELISSLLFASVARHFARIELLDLERVAPFSRRALRGVLVLMVLSAILSLLVIFDVNPTLAINGVVSASLLAAAVFLIPLLPLRRRIDAAKQSELARIRADIRLENEARIAGDEGRTSLADLIMYEQRIERVSTWAFNTPTVVRFALYASLGIGSWLGAAFVERGLGTVLGP